MIAILNGHLDIVKTLFEAGVNVNYTDKVGIYALLLSWFLLCLTMDSHYFNID